MQYKTPVEPPRLARSQLTVSLHLTSFDYAMCKFRKITWNCKCTYFGWEFCDSATPEQKKAQYPLANPLHRWGLGCGNETSLSTRDNPSCEYRDYCCDRNCCNADHRDNVDDVFKAMFREGVYGLNVSSSVTDFPFQYPDGEPYTTFDRFDATIEIERNRAYMMQQRDRHVEYCIPMHEQPDATYTWDMLCECGGSTETTWRCYRAEERHNMAYLSVTDPPRNSLTTGNDVVRRRSRMKVPIRTEDL